jgi:hypothetical protein
LRVGIGIKNINLRFVFHGESKAEVHISSMTPSIRIHVSILVCDTPIQPVLDKYGDYYAMFQALLRQGFKDLEISESKDIMVEFSEHQMVDNSRFPDLENVDAVLLTGSSMLLSISMSE